MNGSNICNPLSATAQEAPIACAVDSLRETQATTHRLIDELENRISSVLSPAPPSGDEAKSGLAGASPLHFALIERRLIAEAHNDKLLGLLKRLAV